MDSRMVRYTRGDSTGKKTLTVGLAGYRLLSEVVSFTLRCEEEAAERASMEAWCLLEACVSRFTIHSITCLLVLANVVT